MSVEDDDTLPMDAHRIAIYVGDDLLCYVTPDYRLAVDQTGAKLWDLLDLMRREDGYVMTPLPYIVSMLIFGCIGYLIGVIA